MFFRNFVGGRRPGRELLVVVAEDGVTTFELVHGFGHDTVGSITLEPVVKPFQRS